MSKKVSLLSVKEALKDQRFRDSLPEELKPDIISYLNNPSCACNVPFYRKLLKDYRQYLSAYFPNAEIIDEEKEIESLAQNKFSVINCSIQELESKLRSLAPGRKQIEMARFEDQITVIVNEIDYVY